MDTKTVSLLKKHIRMIDYIRADLVNILHTDAREAPQAPEPSELYAEFDAAITAGKLTTAEGEHVADCPCGGCMIVRRQKSADYLAKVQARPEFTGFALPVVQNIETQTARALDEIAALFPEQFDGPALAYFRLVGDIPGDGPYYEYETFAAFSYISAAYAIEEWRIGVMKYLAGKTGAIYWRVRPELATDIDFITDKERYKVYARLVVAPVGEVAPYEPGSERLVKLTPDEAGATMRGDVNPFDVDSVINRHADQEIAALDVGEPELAQNEPAPYQRRPLTEYELKKQVIHEAHARNRPVKL